MHTRSTDGLLPKPAQTLPVVGDAADVHAPGWVDTTLPWLAHLRPLLDQALAGWGAGLPVALALPMDGLPRIGSDTPMRFVPQSDLPADEAYETFIHRSASIPTRNNLHDLFNGLVWLTQPAIKQRLNALQAAEIARAGVGAQRGPLRDALTLFDENGALLTAPAVLLHALKARDWHALFITHRAHWAQASLTLIGHALLEKLATAPRKALTAHVLLGDPLAMAPADWAAKPFLPLPVLGVPGWWPANEDPAFYNDVAVFRLPRR